MSPTILVHFEDLETLLVTSKMHCSTHDLSFPAHSCLNRAHRIFVYFVSQKITTPHFGAPLCWRPGAYTPLLPAVFAGIFNISAEINVNTAVLIFVCHQLGSVTMSREQLTVNPAAELEESYFVKC